MSCQRYVPAEIFAGLFGKVYACGGGTIPLLITNLGAVKIVLGIRHFLLYLAFIMIFALMTGFTVNLIL